MNTPIKIVDDVEDYGLRICSEHRYSHDDMEGACSKCKRPIFFQPHPPFLMQFFCIKCAVADPRFAYSEPACNASAAEHARSFGLDTQEEFFKRMHAYAAKMEEYKA